MQKRPKISALVNSESGSKNYTARRRRTDRFAMAIDENSYDGLQTCRSLKFNSMVKFGPTAMIAVNYFGGG